MLTNTKRASWLHVGAEGRGLGRRSVEGAQMCLDQDEWLLTCARGWVVLVESLRNSRGEEGLLPDLSIRSNISGACGPCLYGRIPPSLTSGTHTSPTSLEWKFLSGIPLDPDLVLGDKCVKKQH